MARTDMPRVRHTLVDQVMATYLDRRGQKRPLRPIDRVAINPFGTTIAHDLAAKLMTPENLAVLLKSGTVGNAADNYLWIDVVPGRGRRFEPIRHCRAGQARKAVEFSLRLAGDENAGSISMHFAGTTWQLSSITLPPRVVAELVDRLPIH
jgi:hypothetical protein